PAEAVLEDAGAVEDAVAVVEQVHGEGRGRHGVVAGRLGGRGVEVRVPGVEGGREGTSRLPLEAEVRAALNPRARCTPPPEHSSSVRAPSSRPRPTRRRSSRWWRPNASPGSPPSPPP